MVNTECKVPYILSGIIAILMVIGSLGGLLIDTLYRDNAFVTAVWRGNDFVTLFVAAPLLVASLIIVKRGSQRALLVWFSMLWYTLYNYLYYLFGASFNVFFLLYVSLFTLSIFALIIGLSHLDVEAISHQFRTTTPVKWISGYMMFVAVGLSTVYLIQSLNFIVTGQLPEIIELTGHPTSIVFAIDFPFVVSFFILAAVWLWQRQPWGYVLSVILNVKGAVYTLVLTVGSFSAGATAETPLWIFLTIASFIASGYLLVNMHGTNINSL